MDIIAASMIITYLVFVTIVGSVSILRSKSSKDWATFPSAGSRLTRTR